MGKGVDSRVVRKYHFDLSRSKLRNLKQTIIQHQLQEQPLQHRSQQQQAQLQQQPQQQQPQQQQLPIESPVVLDTEIQQQSVCTSSPSGAVSDVVTLSPSPSHYQESGSHGQHIILGNGNGSITPGMSSTILPSRNPLNIQIAHASVLEPITVSSSYDVQNRVTNLVIKGASSVSFQW